MRRASLWLATAALMSAAALAVPGNAPPADPEDDPTTATTDATSDPATAGRVGPGGSAVARSAAGLGTADAGAATAALPSPRGKRWTQA